MQLRAIQNILENLTKNTDLQWLQKLVGNDLYLTKKLLRGELTVFSPLLKKAEGRGQRAEGTSRR